MKSRAVALSAYYVPRNTRGKEKEESPASRHTVWKTEVDLGCSRTQTRDLGRRLQLAENAEQSENPQRPENGLAGRHALEKLFDHDGGDVTDPSLLRERRARRREPARSYKRQHRINKINGPGSLRREMLASPA